MNNEPIAEAIKYAAMANDLCLVGDLCKLLAKPSVDKFSSLSKRLLDVSDTLAVQDLCDWVSENKKGA